MRRVIAVDSPPGITSPSRLASCSGRRTSTTSAPRRRSIAACSRKFPCTARTPILATIFILVSLVRGRARPRGCNYGRSVSFLRQATVTPADARAAEYVLTFGPPVDVHVNGGIDVFVHGPRRGLPGFSTLVTSGMSDTRMPAPRDADVPITRAELVLYARRPAAEHAELLRALASLPARTGAWFGLYHVVALDERLFLLAPPPIGDRVESP